LLQLLLSKTVKLLAIAGTEAQRSRKQGPGGHDAFGAARRNPKTVGVSQERKHKAQFSCRLRQLADLASKGEAKNSWRKPDTKAQGERSEAKDRKPRRFWRSEAKPKTCWRKPGKKAQGERSEAKKLNNRTTE